MKILSTLAFSACLVTGAVAQQTGTVHQQPSASSGASADVKARVAELSAQLALTPDQAAAAEKSLTMVETRTAPMRQECETIQARINMQYDQAYAEMRGRLTPEQVQKLDQLKKDGKLGSAGCHAGDAKAGAAGCCAGKGQTAARTPAARTATPPKETKQ